MNFQSRKLRKKIYTYAHTPYVKNRAKVEKLKFGTKSMHIIAEIITKIDPALES
jgi:hypothetical protein